MIKKNDKKSLKSTSETKLDSTANLGLESNDDLLAAIRQVAKEMAEAVKKTQKDGDRPIVQESEKNYNDTKASPQSPKKEDNRLKEGIEMDKKELLSIMSLNLNPVSNPTINNNNVIANNNTNNTNKNALNKNKNTPSNIISNNQPSSMATRTTIQNEKEEKETESANLNQIKSEDENSDNKQDEDSDEFMMDISPYLKYEDFKMEDYQEELPDSRKSLYERNVDAYNKLQKKLELQRHKKIKDELQNLKKKPELSKLTKKIIETKFNDCEPIYNRIDEEIFRKNQRLQILKFSLADEERMKDFQNISRFNSGVADQNQIDNFIKTQNEWKKKRDEKIANIKNEMGKNENEATKYLFQPAILKSSEIIAKNKISKIKEKQVYTRLYNLHEEKIRNKKKMEKKSLPSFKPNINKTYPKYLKKSEREKEHYMDIQDADNNSYNYNEDPYSDEYTDRSYRNSEKNNTNQNRHVDSLWENVGVMEDNDIGYNPRGFHNNNSKKKTQQMLSDNNMRIHENYMISGDTSNNNRSDDENYFRYNNINMDKGKNYHSNIHNPLPYEDDYNDDNLFIKEYKKNLAQVHRINSANNIANSKIDYNTQDNPYTRHKKEQYSDWRYAIPKSIHTNNFNDAINDWPDKVNNNLCKINVNDKNDNKIVATPQFAGMIKKNFNIIAKAKMKYSK